MWLADGLCDEPDFCPEGTDGADCCAHFADGVCEEMGKGGECAEDSDWFDCGYCPGEWHNDGFCDEQQFGGSCPTNTDPADCCATWGNDVCEEPSGSDECPVRSDFFDCGYCPTDWIDDGYCAEVGVADRVPLTATATTAVRRCATASVKRCRWAAIAPMSRTGTHCGWCPELWISDGCCHETPLKWACPDGTDIEDCE